MYISKLRLRNWRNFTMVDIGLRETVYIIGPNASGKSNLLDVFRFMRDIVNPKGGGLQHALDSRGGLSKVRSLAARKPPYVELDFELRENLDTAEGVADWRYLLRFQSEGSGRQRPIVAKETVWKHGEVLIDRPDEEDTSDPERMVQTHIEQINMNRYYRPVAEFFAETLYLHLVPQLLKFGDQYSLKHLEADPFGQGLLEEIAGTPKRSRDSRLRIIEELLLKVIPNLEKLTFVKDEISGRPHLQMLYNHWRPRAGWQREDQFSDGTLRLIAMLWTLLSSNRLILLEEPELSLHSAIVEQIPKLLHTIRHRRKKSGGQILVSTHSEAILMSELVGGACLMLKPGFSGEATQVNPPSKEDLQALRSGLSAADVLLPQTGTTIGRI